MARHSVTNPFPGIRPASASGSSSVSTYHARRVVPITTRDKNDIEQWEMDFRFVKEVEWLEREGRVSARPDLELAVGLETGGVASIRSGHRGVSAVNIKRLFELYRGDFQWVMFGGSRSPELTRAFIPGTGRIDTHEAFFHRYPNPARWKVGPRPEFKVEHPTLDNYSPYYPQDPDNEGWEAPVRRNIKDIGKPRGKAKDEQDNA